MGNPVSKKAKAKKVVGGKKGKQVLTNRKSGRQGPLGLKPNPPAQDGRQGQIEMEPPPPPQLQEIFKGQYLDHARDVSYLMQGKSGGQSAKKWFDDTLKGSKVERLLKEKGVRDIPKPTTVQSFLGGTFLRMYLDGKVDPDAVEEAGEEIKASDTFKDLTAKVTKAVQAAEDKSSKTTLEAADVERVTKEHLTTLREKKGIAFRAGLNPVIGGVSKVDVKGVTALGTEDTPTGTVAMYRINVNFFDTYDFENERSGEYDRYRKNLAALLIANRFSDFWNAYQDEMLPIDSWHKTKLDNAAIFASYMYALEKKGWTPGPLSWDVTVPMDILVIQKRAKAKK